MGNNKYDDSMVQREVHNLMARSHNYAKTRTSRDGSKEGEIEGSGRTRFMEQQMNQEALNAYLQSDSPYKSPEHDQPNYDML